MRWPVAIRHPQIKQLLQRCHQELRWLSHQLLPPHCPLCSEPLQPKPDGSIATLCDTCKSQCQTQPPAHCPRCAEPYQASSVATHQCSQCLKEPPPFQWIKTAGIYTEEMGQAMNKFKYHGRPTLAKPLAQCILDQLSTDITEYQPDLIIPVPLHQKRLRERGYNQSLLLARQVGKALDIDVLAQGMIRTRPTSPQSLLNANKRHKNLHGAFEINHELPPQRIILIDDIVTTTTTARACSALLSHHGHTVAVIALGRASLK